MFSRDRRYVVTFNGEIYNFRELRTELEKLGHQFLTRSDTEVLLAAWQEWGELALARIDGIFACALVDRVERSLFLVRDQMGVKPLFYQVRAGSVFFSSELLPLFGASNPCPSENLQDLDSFFTFNYLPAPRTGLQGVKQLPAASLLKVDASGETLQRYWTPPYREELIPWGSQAVDSFRETLFDSVKGQTVSDVPLGLFLSGGLDSYAVALGAVAGGEHPTAYTIGFTESNFDETAAAAEYASYLKIPDQVVQFSWDELHAEKTLAAMGELLADPSCFPLYQLSAFARKNATVILAGDGGDELLAGYGTYPAGSLTPLVRLVPAPLRRMARRLARHLPSVDERYGKRLIVERLLDAAEAGPRRDHASFRRICGDDVKRRFYHPEFYAAVSSYDPLAEYTELMAEVPAGRSYLMQRQHADLFFHLPSILAKVDRMSMAHGLEVRVPLLSRSMVELCINLDDAAKRSLAGGKRILRRALAQDIPPQALRRPKVGLLPPVESWFNTSGPMATIFGDYLITARNSLTTLDWGEVEAYWQEHRQGRVLGGFVLLGVLQYINWSLKCRHT
jgi:asparagine synthase (glutamine-hydrolysing)